MLRSWLWLLTAAASASALAGCLALLDGDEVTYDFDPATGGGGAGATSTTTGATSSSSTSSATGGGAGGGAGGGGAGGGDGCLTSTPSACALDPMGSEVHHFDDACAPGPFCHYLIQDSSAALATGALEIASEGMPAGNGWWPGTTPAPLVFKTLDDGDFVVVTQVTVSGDLLVPPMMGPSNFKVAGLVVRNGSATPTASAEQLFKIEYGYLGDLATPLDSSEFQFGALWAAINGGSGNHLGAAATGTTNQTVGLAACRLSGIVSGYARLDTTWEALSGSSGLTWAGPTSIGLMTGTFNMSGQTTIGRFDYVGFRPGTPGTNCLTSIMELDAELIAGEQ